MKTSHRTFIEVGLALVGVAVFAGLAISALDMNVLNPSFHNLAEHTYSLTLDSSNKVTSAGDKVQKTKIGNDVTFTYASVSGSTTGHVTLNNGGTLVNKDQIRSISSFTCTFSGGTSLKLQSSYGGDVWNDGFNLESGRKYDLGSNPYFLKLTSTGVTTIASVVYEYTCYENPNAHEGEEGGEGLLGVIDFWDSSNSGDTQTQTAVDPSYVQNRSFDSDDVNSRKSANIVSSVSTSTCAYQDRYGGIGMSSNGNAGTLTMTIADGYRPTYVAVIAATRANSSRSLQLNNNSRTVSANSSGITELSSTYTNTLEWEFAEEQDTLSFYASSGSKLAIYRIYLYGESGPSYEKPVDPIGFTAVDSNANNYKMTDIFDTANGLVVKSQFSDGSEQTLSRGGNGYSYVVTDANGNEIDTSSDFGNLGGKDSQQYTVTVSYQSFIPVEYAITVGFVTKVTSIVVNSNYLEFNTAQKFSDYYSDISADLTYNKIGLEETVTYNDFASKNLVLTLLDPNGVAYTQSNAFGIAGTWTIKVASSEYPSVFGEQEITVNAIPVTAVSVTGASATLEEEKTLQLTASVTPNNATVQTVTWSSGNTSVATVNTNGLVTGVSAGNVRITATSNSNNTIFGYIDLTVTAKPAQSEFDADLTGGSNAFSVTVNGNAAIKAGTSSKTGSVIVSVGKGATKLSFYAAGWNAASTTLTLTPNAKVVTKTFSLTADSGIAGSTQAFTLNGNESTYYCETDLTDITSDTDITLSGSARFVIWNAKYYTTKVDPVYPTSISLTGTQSISVGGTSQLAVNYTPNTTNVKNVTYSSNKTNIATVSSTGLVTGIAAGTATITATAETASGNTTATINITVNAIAVSSVSLNTNATTLQVGNTEQLTATISPSDAGNKNVTWSTSDSSVATVSNGLITAVAVGTATITVTTVDGSKTATCNVTVVSNGGGSGASGTATIKVSDIPATYSTSGSATVDGISYTVYNVGNSYISGAMQWKKSSGYIENVTPIEGLLNITIASVSGKSFDGTLYYGSTQSPSTNSTSVSSGNTYNFSGNPSYFKLKTGSTAAGYCGDISLAYSTTPVDPTAITVNPSSVDLKKSGTHQLEVSYTPSNANQNKDVTWSRYSGSGNISVDSNGLVSVSSSASAGNTAVIRATLKSNSSIYSSCTVTVVEQTQDDQTILIYICGSDLESNAQTNSSSAAGYASGDITEILKVANQPDDVNVVIETGGAKCWKTTHGINKNYLERYHVKNKQLVRDSQETKASMGLTSTLQSFLTWGVQTYPADRISLILWNHGGAMRGVCYDENYNNDCLTNSEVKSAVANTFNALGRSTSDKFEWIGYDACLMQVQDIAEFNSQYFNYMVASEESEAGAGWDYDNWLDDAYAKKTTPLILKAIVDSFLKEQGSNSDQTLSYLDLSYMATYKNAWETMASTINSMISSYGKSKFQTLMKTCQYYGSDSDCEGYSYFGIFDAKDVVNKLKATSAFSGASNQFTAVLNAFTNLVAYSQAGTRAGNSYGLCCFFPMKDGSGYTCSTSSVYTSSQTNFTNWRSIVTSYGD